MWIHLLAHGAGLVCQHPHHQRVRVELGLRQLRLAHVPVQPAGNVARGWAIAFNRVEEQWHSLALQSTKPALVRVCEAYHAVAHQVVNGDASFDRAEQNVGLEQLLQPAAHLHPCVCWMRT